jgi:hypothetical protein
MVGTRDTYPAGRGKEGNQPQIQVFKLYALKPVSETGQGGRNTDASWFSSSNLQKQRALISEEKLQK